MPASVCSDGVPSLALMYSGVRHQYFKLPVMLD